MAQYEHLPIYKKAMDVAFYFEQIVRGFSRYNKYILGCAFSIVHQYMVSANFGWKA